MTHSDRLLEAILPKLDRGESPDSSPEFDTRRARRDNAPVRH
jgi:hypothetical protein